MDRKKLTEILESIKIKMEEGKMFFHEDVDTEELIESLKMIKYKEDGLVDMDSVDSKVKTTMIAFMELQNLDNESQNIGQAKIENSLKEYDSLNKQLTIGLRDLVFPRKDIFKKNPIQNSKYILRDSIIYRAGSVRFHLKLLLFIKGSIEKAFTEDLKKINDLPLMIQGTENMLQLFDDIVFHICSMFDYLGNLIGLLYCGQDKMKLKWNGILNSIMDKNNKLSKASIVPILEQTHKELVNPLFNYRTRLIHHKKDSARGLQKTYLGKEFTNIDFNVGFPEMLKKALKIKCLEKLQSKNQEEVNIIKVALILSVESIKNVLEIIKKI